VISGLALTSTFGLFVALIARRVLLRYGYGGVQTATNKNETGMDDLGEGGAGGDGDDQDENDSDGHVSSHVHTPAIAYGNSVSRAQVPLPAIFSEPSLTPPPPQQHAHPEKAATVADNEATSAGHATFDAKFDAPSSFAAAPKFGDEHVSSAFQPAHDDPFKSHDSSSTHSLGGQSSYPESTFSHASHPAPEPVHAEDPFAFVAPSQEPAHAVNPFAPAVNPFAPAVEPAHAAEPVYAADPFAFAASTPTHPAAFAPAAESSAVQTDNHFGSTDAFSFGTTGPAAPATTSSGIFDDFSFGAPTTTTAAAASAPAASSNANFFDDFNFDNSGASTGSALPHQPVTPSNPFTGSTQSWDNSDLLS